MRTKVDIDANFFPNWTRKSLTFSIDDGNVKYDRRLINTVKPWGIRGTFNLCALNRGSPEEYLELYSDYEVANHCKHHPRVFSDGMEFTVSDKPFDAVGGEDFTRDNPVVYRTDIEGLYYYRPYPEIERPGGWYTIAEEEYYIRFLDETRAELEAFFGAGRVRGFVWPAFKQDNTAVKEHILKSGYYGLRRTGDLLDKTGFSLPDDLTDWTYNARERNLLAVMEQYENYPDDGELKFFCFGLHAHDYEFSDKWGDLEIFAKSYGGRPQDYYYATNAEIFDYAEALHKIEISDISIKNPTDIPLYVKINGERVILEPNSTYHI